MERGYAVYLRKSRKKIKASYMVKKIMTFRKTHKIRGGEKMYFAEEDRTVIKIENTVIYLWETAGEKTEETEILSKYEEFTRAYRERAEEPAENFGTKEENRNGVMR